MIVRLTETRIKISLSRSGSMANDRQPILDLSDRSTVKRSFRSTPHAVSLETFSPVPPGIVSLL
jgi:hypothetical protein